MAIKHKREILVTAAIIILFLVSSYYSGRYAEAIREWMSVRNGVGIFAYFLGELLATVVAPVSALPLLPLAVALWGSFWAAIISFAGWLAGSVIAFLLARRFGKPLVARFFEIDKLERIEKVIGEHNLFVTIVVLRIILPADLLSYTLGLFTSISFTPYFWATALGLLPFSFIFSYAAAWPFALQLLLAVAGFALAIWWAKRAKIF
ncbi:TVP38/TMEM64 family protein [Candidatus Falkowbacteria bacterium]|nr:TVP38/TMEM64 family protein [Candidatus Falkowbacteria bacterium]